jgi:hypothetical protein
MLMIVSKFIGGRLCCTLAGGLQYQRAPNLP